MIGMNARPGRRPRLPSAETPLLVMADSERLVAEMARTASTKGEARPRAKPITRLKLPAKKVPSVAAATEAKRRTAASPKRAVPTIPMTEPTRNTVAIRLWCSLIQRRMPNTTPIET